MVTSASISAEILAKRTARAVPGATTAYLVLDTESVPDGELLRRVKYAGEGLSADEAILRAQSEASAASFTGSDFLPVTFQYPVAVCVLRIADDFTIQNIACLDAPQFRTEEMVRLFWLGVSRYPRARLVTFNGRGFDLPLLELAAYDYGFSARDYFAARNRYSGNQLDLMDWISNFGAHRMTGGLDNLSKRLHGDNRKRLLDDVDGPPGKTDGIAGDQVYQMYKAGRLQEINDYCMGDTLDTYFVFLRTRVVTGELSRDQLKVLVRRALEWLESKAENTPALAQYLTHWRPTNLRLAQLMDAPEST